MIPSGYDDDLKIGVDLGDAPRRDHGLVDAEVEDAGGDAVEVRQLEGVEVGQAELAGQPLHGQDVGDRVARAQPDDADAQRSQSRLLLAGELVVVAVEAQRGERRGAEQSHDGPAPRVVDPAHALFHERSARGRP